MKLGADFQGKCCRADVAQLQDSAMFLLFSTFHVKFLLIINENSSDIFILQY